MNKYTSEILNRFWSKVQTGSDDECWNWQAKCRNGYGQFRVNRALLGAHRVSWEIHYGFIPDGMKVCHTCDNPSCVNPKHLFLGTQLDNVHDMIAKGRKAYPRGDSHGMTKITDQQVIEVRLRYARENVSFGALAREYGVSQSTISRIIKMVSHRIVKTP